MKPVDEKLAITIDSVLGTLGKNHLGPGEWVPQVNVTRRGVLMVHCIEGIADNVIDCIADFAAQKIHKTGLEHIFVIATTLVEQVMIAGCDADLCYNIALLEYDGHDWHLMVKVTSDESDNIKNACRHPALLCVKAVISRPWYRGLFLK